MRLQFNILSGVFLLLNVLFERSTHRRLLKPVEKHPSASLSRYWHLCKIKRYRLVHHLKESCDLYYQRMSLIKSTSWFLCWDMDEGWRSNVVQCQENQQILWLYPLKYQNQFLGTLSSLFLYETKGQHYAGEMNELPKEWPTFWWNIIHNYSLTKLMVSHDLLRLTVTNEIALDQRDSSLILKFERTMDRHYHALVSKLETSDTITST